MIPQSGHSVLALYLIAGFNDIKQMVHKTSFFQTHFAGGKT